MFAAGYGGCLPQRRATKKSGDFAVHFAKSREAPGLPLRPILRRAHGAGPAVAAGPASSFDNQDFRRRIAMGYLDPTEYVAYGLTADTTDDWVAMASALMDAYCRRISLLVTQYVERMRLTAGSQAVRLSYLPLMPLGSAASALVEVRVRYGCPRRGEPQDPMLAQVASAFSIPGTWSPLDLGSIDVNSATGEVTFPANFLGLNYNEVEITYTAGLAVVTPAIKVACAQIVKNGQATPAMNVKGSKMDTLQMQYFAGSLVDANVQMLLKPYVAQRIG
jgi:hypothetical protein